MADLLQDHIHSPDPYDDDDGPPPASRAKIRFQRELQGLPMSVQQQMLSPTSPAAQGIQFMLDPFADGSIFSAPPPPSDGPVQFADGGGPGLLQPIDASPFKEMATICLAINPELIGDYQKDLEAWTAMAGVPGAKPGAAAKALADILKKVNPETVGLYGPMLDAWAAQATGTELSGTFPLLAEALKLINPEMMPLYGPLLDQWALGVKVDAGAVAAAPPEPLDYGGELVGLDKVQGGAPSYLLGLGQILKKANGEMANAIDEWVMAEAAPADLAPILKQFSSDPATFGPMLDEWVNGGADPMALVTLIGQMFPDLGPDLGLLEQHVLLSQSVAGPAALMPVQASGGPSGDTAAIHAAAAEGVKAGGGSVPHKDRIQSSFGKYDISGVKAFTGSQAESANKAMGSLAYATGDKVAFKGTPDLHTAAHEVAHVVQQAAGVSLPGGVGSVGDKYEKHADAVADSVVSGQSAEGLLDSMVGGAPGVQKMVQQRPESAVQRRLEAVQRADDSAGTPPATSSTASSGSAPTGVSAELRAKLDAVRSARAGLSSQDSLEPFRQDALRVKFDAGLEERRLLDAPPSTVDSSALTELTQIVEEMMALAAAASAGKSFFNEMRLMHDAQTAPGVRQGFERALTKRNETQAVLPEFFAAQTSYVTDKTAEVEAVEAAEASVLAFMRLVDAGADGALDWPASLSAAETALAAVPQPEFDPFVTHCTDTIIAGRKESGKTSLRRAIGPDIERIKGLDLTGLTLERGTQLKELYAVLTGFGEAADATVQGRLDDGLQYPLLFWELVTAVKSEATLRALIDSNDQLDMAANYLPGNWQALTTKCTEELWAWARPKVLPDLEPLLAPFAGGEADAVTAENVQALEDRIAAIKASSTWVAWDFAEQDKRAAEARTVLALNEEVNALQPLPPLPSEGPDAAPTEAPAAEGQQTAGEQAAEVQARLSEDEAWEAAVEQLGAQKAAQFLGHFNQGRALLMAPPTDAEKELTTMEMMRARGPRAITHFVSAFSVAAGVGSPSALADTLLTIAFDAQAKEMGGIEARANTGTERPGVKRFGAGLNAVGNLIGIVDIFSPIMPLLGLPPIPAGAIAAGTGKLINKLGSGYPPEQAAVFAFSEAALAYWNIFSALGLGEVIVNTLSAATGASDVGSATAEAAGNDPGEGLPEQATPAEGEPSGPPQPDPAVAQRRQQITTDIGALDAEIARLDAYTPRYAAQRFDKPPQKLDDARAALETRKQGLQAKLESTGS